MRIGERVWPNSRCAFKGLWESGCSVVVVRVSFIDATWHGSKRFTLYKGERKAWIEAVDVRGVTWLFLAGELDRTSVLRGGGKYRRFGKRMRHVGQGKLKRPIPDWEEQRRADAERRLAASGGWHSWPVANQPAFIGASYHVL